MTVKTPANLRELERATQLDPNRDLFDDRAAEVAEFFGISQAEAVAMYKSYNVEKTATAPRFDGGSYMSILQSYTHEDVLKRDITRLMLHYTRLEKAYDLLRILGPKYAKATAPQLVDYGCGAADFGLAFAACGFSVTLVDLEDGNLKFARWRFERRGIPVKTIEINSTREYPEFSGADVVVAGDVMEHLRDPRKAVQAVYDGLNQGGYFWFPDFPMKPKKVGGSHLVEAAELREETAKLMLSLFGRHKDIQYLVRRRNEIQEIQ